MKNLVHMFMCSTDEESGTYIYVCWYICLCIVLMKNVYICLCVVLMKNLVHMFMCSADEESGTYVLCSADEESGTYVYV